MRDGHTCALLCVAVAKEQVSTATSAAEVAEARLKSTQEQLRKANDAAVVAEDKARELELAVQVGAPARDPGGVLHARIMMLLQL